MEQTVSVNKAADNLNSWDNLPSEVLFLGLKSSVQICLGNAENQKSVVAFGLNISDLEALPKVYKQK